MFSLNEKQDIAFEGQKWSSARTYGDDQKLDIHTQLKRSTREVFASQHGGQNMVMAFTIKTLTLRRAKIVSKEENGLWFTER